MLERLTLSNYLSPLLEVLMSGEKKSWVTNESGSIIGIDTTKPNADGSSDTTHQEVWGGNVIMPPQPGNPTGTTHNNPDGTSEHKPS